MIDICNKKIPCCGCPDADTCTKERRENLFKELFTKYGSYSESPAERTIHIFENHPSNIYTCDEVVRNMARADADIQRLEKNIAMLKAYKMGLVNRYNYLATSPTREKILLQRVKKYGGKVAYYIIFYSVNLTDGHEVEKDRLTFAGSERRQAFKKFEELAKEHSSAVFEKDVAKKSWE